MDSCRGATTRFVGLGEDPSYRQLSGLTQTEATTKGWVRCRNVLHRMHDDIQAPLVTERTGSDTRNWVYRFCLLTLMESEQEGSVQSLGMACGPLMVLLTAAWLYVDGHSQPA